MIDLIRKTWNAACNLGHIKTNEHAPCEVNEKPKCIHPDAFKRMFEYLMEEILETKAANENNDIIELMDGFCDVRFVLDGLIAQCGIKEDLFNECYKEVYRSNMTKLVEGEFSFKDGKVTKLVSYEPPAISRILTDNGVKIPAKNDE